VLSQATADKRKGQMKAVSTIPAADILMSKQKINAYTLPKGDGDGSIDWAKP
jgi:hypothetical protein